MQPADINDLVWVSDAALAPDGTRVAYSVSRVDGDANRYKSRIWIRAVDGTGAAAPVTSGEWDDRLPAWSPDGSLLAFVTTRRNEHDGITASLYVLHVAGPGEAALIADHPEAITDVAFSPDGRWLSYSARVRGDHYGADEPSRRPPRRIERPFYRLNGAGVVADRPRHIHVAAVDGSGSKHDLTPGDDDWGAPAWLPDSSGLVASRSARRPPWIGSDLVTVPLEGQHQVVAEGGSYHSPSASPDGSQIAFLATDDLDTYPQNTHVAVLPIEGGEVRWISGAFDRTWECFPTPSAPTWLDDGTVAAAVQDRGRVSLMALDVTEPGDPMPVVAGDRTVTTWDRRGSTTVFVATDGTAPAELFLIDAHGERRLTNVSADLCARIAPRPMEHFSATSEGAEVDAWIVTPPDMDPDVRYPVLLNIHGGPFTQYGHTFFDEFQLQATAGFVVIFANPRGSSGREDAWGAAIRGIKHAKPGRGWGDIDYLDLMAVMDTALERFPFIDPDRCGVLGGSYGGYMTSWIIGHTDRFVAACSERAVNNLVALDMGSDTAGMWRVWFGPSGLEDPQEYLRQSPISHVDAMTTPLLIVHSDNDLRCPADQADQLFYALLERDREVEYHLFPEENHELSRSGSPVHRIQRAELILDWFTRHLGTSNPTA